MFGHKEPESRKQGNHDLSQRGLADIPDNCPHLDGVDDVIAVNSDLEVELEGIAGDGGEKPKINSNPKPMASSDLDKMIAESLKDVVSDEEEDADGLDDPDLLNELRAITADGDDKIKTEIIEPTELVPPEEPQQIFLPTTTVNTINTIRQRIELYKVAENNATTAGEAAKARRFERGLKTLSDLLKQALAGQSINVDDIPPEVSIKGGKSLSEETTNSTDSDTPKVPSRSAPPPPAPSS